MSVMARDRSVKWGLRLLVLAGLGLAGQAAHAGVLYKCKGPHGSTAYTNRPGTFTDCSALSAYPDANPVGPAPGSPVGESGWNYRDSSGGEPPVAGFGDVRSGAASSAPSVAPSGKAPAPQPDKKGKRLATAAKVLRGAVYRVDHTGGTVEYTNVKPSGGSFAVLFTYIATCFACDLHSTIDWASTPLNLDAYRDQIRSAASTYGVDAALLRAVIHAESAYNPLAVSIKGAQGLMQLMPGTAGDLGVGNPFDPGQNISGGARYLAQLLKEFNGDVALATAAYNAGDAAVRKYGGVPPYDETRLYVKRVATLLDRYRKAL